MFAPHVVISSRPLQAVVEILAVRSEIVSRSHRMLQIGIASRGNHARQAELGSRLGSAGHAIATETAVGKESTAAEPALATNNNVRPARNGLILRRHAPHVGGRHDQQDRYD